MSAIIETNNNWMEYQSHRVYPEVWNENTETEHWIAVPSEFESVIVGNAPYIEVTYNEDKTEIINAVATERPEPQPPQYHPSEVDNLIIQMLSE